MRILAIYRIRFIMTTPLSLKTFQISNQMFKCILKHNAFAHFSTKTKNFETIHTARDLLYYYLYTLCLFSFLLCTIDVSYEMCVSKSLKFSLAYLIVSIFLFAVESSIIFFIICFLPNRKVIYCHLVNNLLAFECSILDAQAQKFSKATIVGLLEEGTVNKAFLKINELPDNKYLKRFLFLLRRVAQGLEWTS